MVEEELKVARQMVELERKEKELEEMARQIEKQRMNHLYGRWQQNDDPTAVDKCAGNVRVSSEGERKEELFKQIEESRKEELEKLQKSAQASWPRNKGIQSSNELTKQKIKEMLERKKREINLRSETVSSDRSFPRSVFDQKVEVNGGLNEVFDSDEGYSKKLPDAGKLSPTFTLAKAPTNIMESDPTSVLGEVIPDQQELWEKIQRKKEEDEERLSSHRHGEVVKEQQEILKSIQEQNDLKKKEEELTLKLIAELSLCDQRQQQQHQLLQKESTAATETCRGAAAFAPSLDRGELWSEVGGR